MSPVKPNGQLTIGAWIAFAGLTLTILSTFAFVVADYVQGRSTLDELRRGQEHNSAAIATHERRITGVESRVAVLDDRYARP